ncbi:MAG: MaoC family dehydratase, partial [Pseudomonadota bacterium]
MNRDPRRQGNLSDIRRKAREGLEAGDVFEVTRTFTPADVAAFEDLSRDYNPVHSSRAFAAAKGFNGTVCHGLLVASLLTEIGGQLGWLAARMDLCFRRPVHPGDEITCRWEVTSLAPDLRAAAAVHIMNSNGDVVLEATITGRVPGPGELDLEGV